MLLKISRFPFDGVSSTTLHGFTLPSVHGSRSGRNPRTDELGARALWQSACQNPDALRRTLCKTFGVVAQRRSAARRLAGGEWQCELRRALWLHSSWTWSRPLKRLHLCPARLPLLPSEYNSLCVRHVRSQAAAAAAVEQYRRASTARRCGLLLYAGLHRAQRSGASGAAAYERSAAILMGSCGTAVATVATACSAWLPRPAEHRFFASGGDRALGTDASSVGGS